MFGLKELPGSLFESVLVELLFECVFFDFPMTDSSRLQATRIHGSGHAGHATAYKPSRRSAKVSKVVVSVFDELVIRHCVYRCSQV